MLYKNAWILTPEGYVYGSFRTKAGDFTGIRPADSDRKPSGTGSLTDDAPSVAGEPFVDLMGAKVLPGLIDIHTHGNSGMDFSDGSEKGLAVMAAYLARHGITGFAPTSMTLPYGTLAAAFETAVRLKEQRPEGCARVLGIHMEGPYFSEKKKGAQNGDYLHAPDPEGFKKLYEKCGGLIKILDIAPDLPGAAALASSASGLCTVSAAHTDASYEEATAFFEAGASHLTHLFNAMPAIHHRRPGVIGAASEREDVTAELICDGLHVHPSAVRMAFRLFPERICLISDTLRCCGMPDGKYMLGGQMVCLQDDIARLSDGTIAGSATNLWECMRRAIRFGIPEETAIRAATINPAKVLGAADELGSIEPGKKADFVVCDHDLNCLKVFIGDQEIRFQP